MSRDDAGARLQRNPIARDRRRARRTHGLPADAACAFCGEQNPDALRAYGRTIVEGHHAAGTTHDEQLVVALCATHHDVVTALGWDAALDLTHEPRDVLARTAGALESLAVFYHALGDAQLRMADGLRLLEVGLDRRYRHWRALPEAGRDA